MNAYSDQVERLLAGPCPLPIVAAGLPVLRQSAAAYDGQLDDDLLFALVDAMRQTMIAAPGVGLAAPQVGVGLQIAVLEDTADVDGSIAVARDRQPLPFQVLINPRYTPVGDDRAEFYEGCLSVPGYQAVVARPAVVALKALDQTGAVVNREYRGWSARIVQHETDHLAGVLYLDKAITRSLAENSVYQALWSGSSIEPARRMLGF
jgi:peptide deformylase